MSLEQQLETLNGHVAALIAILNTGISAQAELGAPEAPAKKTRAKKADDAAPAATVYWNIPSLNSVFAQEPGMGAPTMTDAVQITQQEYDAKKAEQRAKTDAVIAAHSKPTSAPSTQPPADSPRTAEVVAGAAPAPSTAQQEPQSSTAPNAAAGSADEVSFADVMASAKAVNSSSNPGCGREGVMSVLKQFLPGDATPTVTKLQPLGQNAAIKAAFDALLSADFDPLA